MMSEDIFQVEEIEAISFDEDGQEDGTWIGWAVTSIDDPSRHCFECRNEVNADQLCDFLNENLSRDTSLNDDVSDNLSEWSGLVTELSKKEVKLLELKDIIFDKEQWIIENTDFKAFTVKIMLMFVNCISVNI